MTCQRNGARAAAAALLVASTASMSFAQLHVDLHLRRATEVAQDVPVQVLGLERSDHGASVRLFNAAAHPIVAVQVIVGEPLHDPSLVEFMGVASVSPAEWRPGEELVVQLYTQGLSAAPVAHVRAIVLADGTGHGDPRVVSGFRQRFKDLHDSAVDVLALLNRPSPADDEALHDLLDSLRLAERQATRTDGRGDRASAYTSAIGSLERLQGREIAGTDRMERELASVRTRLRAQRDAARRFPMEPPAR